MKSPWFKKALPHLIAVVIFLVVAAFFCRPALQSGMVLGQSDVSHWEGMAHNSTEYHKAHGRSPLWTPSSFSGMPTYQIGFESPWTPVSMINSIMTLWLPKPINFFFLASICFYIFCMCVRIRPWVAIVFSLGFAYASFMPIIVGAGHDTQMLTFSYLPALLGSVILIYEKKYLTGFALTALFTMMNIGMNHQQISYYFLIVAGFMTISYAINWIRNGETKHLLTSLALVIVAGISGVLVNATSLFVTAEYTRYSKRGGQLVLDKTPGNNETVTKDNKTTGLTQAYAFQWSYGRAETMTLMFPGVLGYGARGAELTEGSHIAKFLVDKANQPEEQAGQIAAQLSSSLYWGDQPFTEGPVYLGAVICLMFVFGLVYYKSHHRWWILAACALTILMSWGSNLAGFNGFLFDHLPLYNKFRVPTMILVVPQLLFPVLGALALNRYLDKTDTDGERWSAIKNTAIGTGILFVVAALFYFSSDFRNENVARTEAVNKLITSKSPDASNQMAMLNEQFPPKRDNQVYESLLSMTQGNADIAKGILSALRQDRSSIFGKDLVRSLIFAGLGLALLGLFAKNKINGNILVAGLGALVLLDLMPIDKKFLNEENFTEAENYEAQSFPKTEADEMILRDKEPNFRVFNTTNGDFSQESKTSYYHNSIGGYSPAKLGIVDDLNAYQLSGNVNRQVLNMLNVKYFIQADPQTGKPRAIENDGRLGNAWIVKGLHVVQGAAEEMTALTNLNTRDSAVTDASFQSQFSAVKQFDSTASIRMTNFDNEKVTYVSTAAIPQIAVFSEIYYPAGWDVFVDGQKSNYFKANYVLRAMVIPAGKHKIEFIFEPASYKVGTTLARIFSIVILLLLAGAAFFSFRKKGPLNVS